MRPVASLGGTALVVLAAAAVLAQEPDPSPSPPEPAEPEEARSTGLPSGLDWTFNLDASWGTFGFANSLYQDPKPEQPSGDLSDQWFEGAAKPALTATWTAANASQLYAKLSVVGERTYGAAPTLVGEDASSYDVEDLHIGWRSGGSIGLGENALELTVGRAPYRIGNMLLLGDGAAEGGHRGGYWTNARKAFEFAALGRLKAGAHRLEAFYLDKDDLPEADSGSRLWGGNYELAIGEDNTFGATYMRWLARPEENPGRDGLDVFHLRAYTAPVPKLPGLAFEAEYALERNGDTLHSDAWSLQAAYEIDTAWSPRLSYRYARFRGDDPATPANEGFDPLLPGLDDWGTWWQGEIAGEYFVSNSNLVSHQVRLHLAPSEGVGTGLIAYKFFLDQPSSFDPGLAADDIAFEVDAYLDWEMTDNFTVSVVAAFANPGDAVSQTSGRTKNFSYGMVYLGYSY
ncbi:MAG TPA: alginate export family protein [Vicinamibacteria bacterium]|nr:alginate export family protein [Vicinamibacteria bacterium]